MINNPTIALLNQMASQGEKITLKKYSTRDLGLELIRVCVGGKHAMKHSVAKKRGRDMQDLAKRKKRVPHMCDTCEIVLGV